MYEAMSLRQYSWSLAAAGSSERKEAAQEIAATPSVKDPFNFALLLLHLRSDVFILRLNSAPYNGPGPPSVRFSKSWDHSSANCHSVQRWSPRPQARIDVGPASSVVRAFDVTRHFEQLSNSTELAKPSIVASIVQACLFAPHARLHVKMNF